MLRPPGMRKLEGRDEPITDCPRNGASGWIPCSHPTDMAQRRERAVGHPGERMEGPRWREERATRSQQEASAGGQHPGST